MNQADEPRFALVMASVAAAFGTQAEPARIESYFGALAEFPIEAVEAACARWIKTGRFFPFAADIRELLTPKTTKLAAAEAWGVMVRLSNGPHGRVLTKNPHPTDEAANKAMELLGPMPLISDWEGPWAEKKFAELYEMVQDRDLASGIALGAGEAPKELGT